MDKSKSCSLLLKKESNIYGQKKKKKNSGVSVLSRYSSSHLWENVETALPPEGSIGIQYMDGLLVESETKKPSRSDTLALLQFPLFTRAQGLTR